ncbi:universal stress protein [Chachezhania sediminis]|uniref:universal stress protein n=1 Tax=Chachezhania sediminis TaxID=2599291 RepID=UPI00131A92CD|nr:universal stress protein [Chachezhania sediminis]
MTDKIIAMVDGSIYSQSVCDHVAWVAGRTGCAVELIHVLGRREGAEKKDYSGSLALGARSQLLGELAELDAQRAKLVSQQGRAILEDAQKIVTDAGVTDVTTRLFHGDLVDTVMDREQDADFVVIGKRGEAADFAKAHLGSNLERVVRASKRPVMAVARKFRPIEKVLIAYDGGVSSRKAVEHVARTPLYRGLDVHVVTIGTSTEETRRGLDDAEATLDAAGLAATSGVISGKPDTALAEFVDLSGYDLLVMGAYGHSRIRTLIIGSTTTEMLRSCQRSVLLVR